MKSPQPASHAEANIVALPEPRRQGRIPSQPTTRRQRFRVLPFTNESGSTSWRVQGMKRDGVYVRRNFSDLVEAQNYQIELECEYRQRQPDDPTLRQTSLSETQLRTAEAGFAQLAADDDLLPAVSYWLKHGQEHPVVESPRLDEAVEQFNAWLHSPKSELRPRSVANLKCRVRIFANSVPNLRVTDIQPEVIEQYLDKRHLAPESRRNDKKAISRFLSWCKERPRRWVSMNAAKEIVLPKTEKPAPAILTLAECESLLKAAQGFKNGRLVPRLAVSLFGGLRPNEAARLTWDQVNLADRELRLEGPQTKTGVSRVVTIGATLKSWLSAYKGLSFHPPNYDHDFPRVLRAAGFGRPTPDQPGLKPWTPDVLRHTAISHFWRKTGSYGLAAAEFGNSERIIREHYQARVSSAETKAFYSLTPTRKARP